MNTVIQGTPITVGTNREKGESPESVSQDSMQLQGNATVHMLQCKVPIKNYKPLVHNSSMIQMRRRHLKSGQATANERSLVHVRGSTTGSVRQ